MAIEGRPLHAEDNSDSKELPRSKAKKPEAIGLLAVETKPGSQHSPERIGHVLVNSEARPEERATSSTAEAPSTGKRIDTLSRTELMELSEKIMINDSSLRQIYETHLIGERGLRRLVTEYMHEGDLSKALRNEVMEREMDFERDPAMRDITAPASDAVVSGNAELDKLLQKAAISVADSGEEAAFFKARARYEVTHSQQHHRQQRLVIDISLFIIIATLVLAVVVMYLTRH